MRKDIMSKLFNDSNTEFDLLKLDSEFYSLGDVWIKKMYNDSENRIMQWFTNDPEYQIKNAFYVFSSLKANFSEEDYRDFESLKASVQSDKQVMIEFYAPYQEYLFTTNKRGISNFN